MHGNNISWVGINDFTIFGEKKPVTGCEIVKFESALKLYSGGTYVDAATPHWEKMRFEFLENGKKDLWDRIFDEAKGYAEAAFKKSDKAQQLEKRLDVGETIFIADLPCIGAAMERALYSDWQELFYNRALNVYNSGYWICGYRNEKYIVCGEYE